MRPTAFLYWEVSQTPLQISRSDGAEGKLIVIVLLNTDINDYKHPLNVYFSFKSTKMRRLGKFALDPFLVL